MNIADFDFDLPPEAIAQQPAPERDGSRLLHLQRNADTLSHFVFRDLPTLLRKGDLLVVNRTRVFPARLLGQRASGGRAEIFLLKDRGSDHWDAFVQPGRRLRPGDTVQVGDALRVTIESGATGADMRRVVRLQAREGTVAAALEREGRIPLPPYVRRDAQPDDRQRYQTVYAREAGSVAAPTAGLHFTDALFTEIRARGIDIAEVVLHVGPGTFKPVTVEDVREHQVEPEPYWVPEETARAVTATRQRQGRVIAVGTTSARTLETVGQEDGTIRATEGETSLVIRPGHTFRVVDALITNFHLPRSSLLLLVSAFAGRERILAAYAAAVKSGYRFYSYGDAMLID